MNSVALASNPNLALDSLIERLRTKDFLYLDAQEVLALLESVTDNSIGDDDLFLDSWNGLEQDHYMADGGRYRKRRHATYSASPGEKPLLMPHQAHFQTQDYNPLNGGIARYFAPIMPNLLSSVTLRALLDFGNKLFSRITPAAQWHIELHQFRIEARDGQKGNPTPEGVHRDGVDFVIVLMIKRVNIESGATTIYNLEHELVGEFTLAQTFDMVIVDDHKLYHGVTPITQLDQGAEAYRDVLVMTFKKNQGQTG